MPDQTIIALAFPLSGYVAAWLLLWEAGRRDRRGWLSSRAPALPVGALSEHDDAWLRGVIESAEPLRCPWFDVECVYYSYDIERKVTRAVKSGKHTTTQTTWVTDHSEERAQRFVLVDGNDRIEVDLPAGEAPEAHPLGIDYEDPWRRHSATALLVGATVSVLGVRRDDRTFGRYREVPLVTTFAKREDYLYRVARGERWLRFFGFACALLGGTAGTLWWCSRAAPLGLEHWALALPFGVVALLPVWAISTYNRLVRTQQQAEAAWRQIDVDLDVRDDLLPQLAAVVESFADHERALQVSAAALRADSADRRVVADGEVTALSRRLLALVERHPELRANELFADLHRRLWALEEKLAASRTFYNGVCEEWNRLVEAFPSSLVAGLCGHRPRAYFAQVTAIGPASPENS